MEKMLREAIANAGQEHLLRFYDGLTESEKSAYDSQLADVDWEKIPDLVDGYVLKRPDVSIPENLQPAEFFPLHPDSDALKELYQRASARGEELLRDGKVCCLTVAGGQGTRLGFDGPKGTYPIGPVSGRTLFAYFAQSIIRASEKFGRQIKWFIMTSPINREATENYFRQENFFGMKQDDIFFFTQGTMPAFGVDGKLLMSSRSSLALSPDGHGGTLLALRKSGALAKMAADGCEYISYFQVDNPLVPVADPLFVGMHALENAEMSAIMLSKTNSREKLGNFCVSEGKTMIIEYSDLPEELAEKRNPDGSLAFIAGSPAIHVLSRSFVEKLTVGDSLQLPWHRADKKIPFFDGSGIVAPESANGVKLESFIFDALPLAEKVMLLEGDRAEVFAPTKNATGVDSAESCRRMISERNARRLAKAGVQIPFLADGSVDAVIELSPRLIFDDSDAADLVRANGLKKIFSGESVVL